METKIKFRTGGSWHVFNPGVILFFQAKGNASIVTFKDGHTLEINLCLSELEQHFSSFFQINNACIINLEFLNNVSELENGFVLIDNRYKIPIDKEKKKLLSEALTKLS